MRLLLGLPVLVRRLLLGRVVVRDEVLRRAGVKTTRTQQVANLAIHFRCQELVHCEYRLCAPTVFARMKTTLLAAKRQWFSLALRVRANGPKAGRLFAADDNRRHRARPLFLLDLLSRLRLGGLCLPFFLLGGDLRLDRLWRGGR